MAARQTSQKVSQKAMPPETKKELPTLKYVPTSHSQPETAKVDSTSIVGLAPGPLFTVLNDPHGVAATVWLPTGTTGDGLYPDKMMPFTTASVGTVS